MLNESAVRSARPSAKSYSMTDIRGLHLSVMPSGRKFWRMRYTNGEGKRSWHTIGEYPSVSLDDARTQVSLLQEKLKAGEPISEKRTVSAASYRFGDIAAEWLAYNDTRDIVAKYKRRTRSDLTRYALPTLADLDIRRITPQDVKAVLTGIAAQGKRSTVAPVRVSISQIFRYAAAHGLVQYDPCSVVRGAISVPAQKHHPSPSNSEEIGSLLRAVNGIARKKLRLAMFFVIYSLCRHGEMRHAEWSEIDMDKREWHISGEKMKMRRSHIVPLSRQLIAIIEAMRPLTGNGRYIFASNYGKDAKDGSKPICDQPLRDELVRIGYPSDKITVHGFRGMASTILNENGFNSDWIERQLAHVEGNKVRAAYNYADFLDDRRKMLQWYGDHLDALMGEPMNLG